ncbi:hypothetical protein PHET_09976 [Paragonimus heterotremus]|uniref:Uncharacterized protein n=1 Tax=Paragonimus heterotremus TaxID=100268 RepID=A0A8J4SUT0_9TREM|nr:hypothetical protein PHET_09976 [Paragonimus heterotremus]
MLESPDTDSLDKQLRDMIINRATPSDCKRVDQLFSNEPIGDSSPFQLLGSLQNIFGSTKLDDALLAQISHKFLPVSVDCILTPTSGIVFIDQLASIADGILDVQTSAVNSIQPATPNDQLHEQLTALIEQVSQLRFSRTNKLDHFIKGHSHQPSRSLSPRQNDRSCWYHQKFDHLVHKCTPPCEFQSKNLSLVEISWQDNRDEYTPKPTSLNSSVNVTR